MIESAILHLIDGFFKDVLSFLSTSFLAYRSIVQVLPNVLLSNIVDDILFHSNFKQ